MAYSPESRSLASSVPDLRAAYTSVLDALATLYWQSADASTRELVFAAREQVGQLLDALNQQQLASNSQALAALQPQLQAVNASLGEVRNAVSRLTQDLATVSRVVDAISLALALTSAL